MSGIFKIVRAPDGSGTISGFAYKMPDGARSIVVPGRIPLERISYDYSYSSVFPDYHGFVWYYRTFEGISLPAGMRRIDNL